MGKKGGKREGAGRPPGTVASATLMAQEMRRQLTTAVHAEFEELYRPQILKAKKGDLAAFNSLMDRAGVKVTEEAPPSPGNTYNIFLQAQFQERLRGFETDVKQIIAHEIPQTNETPVATE